MTSFEIKTEPGNKTGSLPPHHDIYLRGQSDSIVTVWIGEEFAREIVRLLDARAKGEA